MSAPEKIRYEIVLEHAASPAIVAGATVRPIVPSDRDALAELMLDAYVGTIDYEGETLQEARHEVASWFEEQPLLDHSYCAIVAGQLSSAVLVSERRSMPFIGYVMTRASQKHRGLARLVTQTSLNSLIHGGHERVVFFITAGNTASEALFSSLGARAVPEV